MISIICCDTINDTKKEVKNSMRSVIREMLAGEKGVKILQISPTGNDLAEEEWIKWLNYIPPFQQERVNRLLSKTAFDLTDDEIEELRIYKKEMKMASIAKIYGEEKINKKDALEYIDYANQRNLEQLIKRKLTSEEYKKAREVAHQLVRDLSYNELLDYCRDKGKNFAELSMVDSFILREVSKAVHAITNKKLTDALSYEIEKNELMRQRSTENASKRFLL